MESHSQIFGKAQGTRLKRMLGRIVGVTGVKDTTRMWLKESPKQGSEELMETEVTNTQPD